MCKRNKNFVYYGGQNTLEKCDRGGKHIRRKRKITLICLCHFPVRVYVDGKNKSIFPPFTKMGETGVSADH